MNLLQRKKRQNYPSALVTVNDTQHRIPCCVLDTLHINICSSVTHYFCSIVLCNPCSFRDYLYLLEFYICSFESCILFFFFSQEHNLYRAPWGSSKEVELSCFLWYSKMNHLYIILNIFLLLYREIPFKAQGSFGFLFLFCFVLVWLDRVFVLAKNIGCCLKCIKMLTCHL